MLNNSKWIWQNDCKKYDTYAEFYDSFKYKQGNVKLDISVDSNYVVYINGRFVNSGQYPDFPYYKVYDELDLTDYCNEGINNIAIIVWYYGKENMSYYPGNPALRYEVYNDNELLCYSDSNTLSRISKTYKNEYCKIITGQLGYSYLYDCSQEDNWKTGGLKGFSKSTEVDQQLAVYKRPVKKLDISEICIPKLIVNDDSKHYLYDIGYEEVGYFSIKLKSQFEQTILVSYGEHIADGGVRRKISGRDFSFELKIGKGEYEYANYFRRLGLRYLEVFADAPIQIEYIGIYPCSYPVKKVDKKLTTALDQRIYDVCVRTLELCMHDHYEDCPWREQALYAMDSRNQMLCGYYAFKEFDFPRANLYLMSKDDRKDGLLSICTPSGNDLTIPSFSLHYFIEVYEYTMYSKDTSLVLEILPKLESILKVFLDRIDSSGLIPNFSDRCHWNFYEWALDLDGSKEKNRADIYDAALNCLLSLALDRMDKIYKFVGKSTRFEAVIIDLNNKIRKNFYNEESRLFKNSSLGTNYSELVNSLALLCGAVQGKRALDLAKKLVTDDTLIKATLSMVCFKYDALLSTDLSGCNEYILSDIRKKYKKMLDAGATSFWETEKGESDFNNAGSLCHGWSAMPVYYYNILL